MNIFSNHAHVFQKKVRPDGTISKLMDTMDKTGIEKSVVFAPFNDFFDSSDRFRNPNEWLANEISKNQRLMGFGVIDFTKSNLQEQVVQIKELGLKGIKVHPPYQKIKVDGELANQVYEKAEELHLPISFHTGVHWYRLSQNYMLLYDEVAYAHKSLKFSLEHVGGYSFFNEAVAVMVNNPHNVYAGLTSVFDCGKNKKWYLNDDQVKDLILMCGASRCIFGLDFPYNDENKIKDAINKVMSLPISNEEKEMILGGNLNAFISE